MISLRPHFTWTAIADEYKLDKKETSYDDIIDAFSLGLQFTRGRNKNNIFNQVC
jgi:hypothetical protein